MSEWHTTCMLFQRHIRCLNKCLKQSRSLSAKSRWQKYSFLWDCWALKPNLSRLACWMLLRCSSSGGGSSKCLVCLITWMATVWKAVNKQWGWYRRDRNTNLSDALVRRAGENKAFRPHTFQRVFVGWTILALRILAEIQLMCLNRVSRDKMWSRGW